MATRKGGSYLKQKDGSLKLVHRTARPNETAAPTATPAAKPAPKPSEVTTDEDA
jgi:hypothetical protein